MVLLLLLLVHGQLLKGRVATAGADGKCCTRLWGAFLLVSIVSCGVRCPSFAFKAVGTRGSGAVSQSTDSGAAAFFVWFSLIGTEHCGGVPRWAIICDEGRDSAADILLDNFKMVFMGVRDACSRTWDVSVALAY